MDLREIKKAPESIPAETEKCKGFNIVLITPMYGGGAIAGLNAPDFPIRPTSIRGQLRFWWRATRGAAFSTSDELFKKEKEIWGSVDEPSNTIVKVETPLWSQKRKYVGLKDDNYEFKRFGDEAYVLFSAAAKTNQHDLVREGLEFKLSISNKNKEVFEEDVLCAVWAWVNFGGIGARTRRGCGALYCKELAPESAENFHDWFKGKIELYKLNLSLGTLRGWPTLPNLPQILKKGQPTNALTAWKNAIKPMRDFRQGEGIGRNAGPGRSFWPEPDTIRNAFGFYSTGHKPDPLMPNGFPRAAFGLPIIFEFYGSPGDPDSELCPQGAKRMGSPVILRPLKTKTSGAKNSVPLAIFLNASLPCGLELNPNPTNPITGVEIIDPAFSGYPNSPIGNALSAHNTAASRAFTDYFTSKYLGSTPSKNGNALDAFAAYLIKEGWR